MNLSYVTDWRYKDKAFLSKKPNNYPKKDYPNRIILGLDSITPMLFDDSLFTVDDIDALGKTVDCICLNLSSCQGVDGWWMTADGWWCYHAIWRWDHQLTVGTVRVPVFHMSSQWLRFCCATESIFSLLVCGADTQSQRTGNQYEEGSFHDNRITWTCAWWNRWPTGVGDRTHRKSICRRALEWSLDSHYIILFRHIVLNWKLSRALTGWRQIRF